MLYRITHRLDYEYSYPVFLEAQLLHLKPVTDTLQHLKDFKIKIDPTPALISDITDALGNPAHEIWFRGSTEKLSIEAESLVEVFRQNPFNYILRENSFKIPIRYPEILLPSLRPYLHVEKLPESIMEFAGEAATRSGFKTTEFLSELCLMVHQRIQYERREEGFPWPAEKTLAKQKGSCRDVAFLFMTCCRAMGIAARFTSGYVRDTENRVGNELHAWTEVYMEGAGWRGYDAVIGLAVDENYVVVASAPDPRLVTPVIGTFRSNTATSRLQTQVKVVQVSSSAQ